MKFTLWSVWHILYILSPFVLFSVIYLCTRKASEKTKRIVGIVMGALSLVVIIARNVDIYVREGMGGRSYSVSGLSYRQYNRGTGVDF